MKTENNILQIIRNAIIIAVIVIVVILFQPPKQIKSNTNETYGKQSPIVNDTGGSVTINFQNEDPFAEDSMKSKNNKSSK